MKKSRYLILLLGLALLLVTSTVGCPDDGDNGGVNGDIPPSPAAFSVSNLSIEPADVKPGEPVTVSVTVANTGGSQGSRDVILNINGVQEETQNVTIDAGSSQVVTFHVSKENPSSYVVTVDNLNGYFTVTQVIEANLIVYFIDVGQGDSILIDLGDTEILIDGGGRTPGVVTYLDDIVDGNLEVVVATHPHADHIGGLIAVLQAFTVEQVWLNGDTSTSQTYAEFMISVQAENAQVMTVDRGDVLVVGGLSFTVLNPAALSGSTNNKSIVLSLTYGDIDVLFTGDAEQEAESSMLAAGILSDIDILKVGHHGSHSSSSLSFLNVVKPEVAIYMAGASNSYGHPHDEAINALCNIGAEIYGTDIHGTITVIVNSSGYIIQLESQIPPIDCSGNDPAPISADVQITDIFYEGTVTPEESDEYVEINNLGTEPVNLQGWKLINIDEGYPELIFPYYILNPGQSIRVYTNEIHPEYGGFSFGQGTAVWNNTDPDTAVLYDADGNEVSRRSY